MRIRSISQVNIQISIKPVSKQIKYGFVQHIIAKAPNALYALVLRQKSGLSLKNDKLVMCGCKFNIKLGDPVFFAKK